MRVAWGQFKGRDEVSLKVHWVKIRDEVPPRPELVSIVCTAAAAGEKILETVGTLMTDTHTADTAHMGMSGTRARDTWGD